MEFKFKGLTFKTVNEQIALVQAFENKRAQDEYHELCTNFVEVQIAGENKDSHFGNKTLHSSEGTRLKYRSYTLNGNRLSIVQDNERISVETVFFGYDDTNAIRAYTRVTNISKEEITLEEVSALRIYGLADGLENTEKTWIYKFTQSHHAECQPRKYNFFELGLFPVTPISNKRISGGNIGSWSTKEELPQAIIEYDDKFTMFEIESNNSWYYEISDSAKELYLSMGGGNINFGGWTKNLKPNESYETKKVAICFGNSLNDVLGEMTKYRRHIRKNCKEDENLPTIFNEYMHLSWDSPTEENTRKVAPIVAKTGVEYYVIDCGWHNEEKGSEIYPYVGQWKESKTRFPHGVRAITDFIRSLGMKAGLWIEPEIIGYKCQEMLDYYDDDCFITRHGKKILTMGRYFVDYRNEKVKSYMTETIRRMVEDYGADYIKMDYNEDMGIGTDKNSDSYGEGLEQCAKAYLEWVDELNRTFPNVLFETCSSGGNRMDYETMSHFSIVSTSDQTDYRKYPYIAGNILSSILPEQGAVWSYPVDSYGEPNSVFVPNEEWVEEHISEEQVVMNMINSFLGRMHLASHIELLSNEKLQLVKEGVDYFKSIQEDKKKALPYLPIGFTDFKKDTTISGFKTNEKIYLGVWNLGGSTKKKVYIADEILGARITYPKESIGLEFSEHELLIELPEKYSARFIEIELKR